MGLMLLSGIKSVICNQYRSASLTRRAMKTMVTMISNRDVRCYDWLADCPFFAIADHLSIQRISFNRLATCFADKAVGVVQRSCLRVFWRRHRDRLTHVPLSHQYHLPRSLMPFVRSVRQA